MLVFSYISLVRIGACCNSFLLSPVLGWINFGLVECLCLWRKSGKAMGMAFRQHGPLGELAPNVPCSFDFLCMLSITYLLHQIILLRTSKKIRVCIYCSCIRMYTHVISVYIYTYNYCITWKRMFQCWCRLASACWPQRFSSARPKEFWAACLGLASMSIVRLAPWW